MSSELPKLRLGWIGLGRMGHAMAGRLARAGADIRGYNRTRAKAESLVADGVKVVDRPADLADCDIVFTMVSTAGDLKAVTFGEGGLFSDPKCAPKILAELSTVSPEDSAEMRSLAAARGTQMLAVPVSGNDVVARAGRLSVIASGPRAAFDTVEPYLQVFGPSVTYVGEGDVGRIVKICHNLYLGIAFTGLSEVALLAESHGVPRHLLLEVLNKSVLGSTFSRYKTPVIANLDYTVTFTNTLMKKDLELGLKAARETGVPLPTTEVVRDIVQANIDGGRAEQDYTLILDELAKRAGMALKSENAAVGDGLS
ncbi:MAG: NAD(P)-dependent oxidoreductase [Alphaproteobacteria bacterium]|nr:NAD(P)-dependent oxidoreductase [Alphaproteobacteria bacterium]